jgi:hypothetical protein
LEPRDGDPYSQERARVATALDQFRSKAAVLADEVSRSVPNLTDHSVRHLDALWEISGQIAGPEFQLNPTEALVFGGAILLHDLGNAVAAYPRGLQDLKGPEWDDLVFDAFHERFGKPPTPEESANPPEEVYSDVLLRRLRQAHADRAEALATQGFFHCDDSEERIYLLEDDGLRDDLGPIIGRIASSHHWEISKVVQELCETIGTPPELPSDWTIDRLTLACLLRVADAAHLDSRRAPTLSRTFRRPRGDSAVHWGFQGRLLRPVIQDDQLVFSAKGPFPVEERDAWWLCYETLQNVDQELRRVDAVMRRERKLRRFAARSVSSIESPQVLTRHIRTVGWDPIDIRLRISDVLAVVDRFGGRKLYGDKPAVALRELIANAADAVRARRYVEERHQQWGLIEVQIGLAEDGWWLEVSDNGIGMSAEVLQGQLLDFGASYWRSELAMREHPGLLSSGFKPTGLFGIGFFSVFMLGERVRVVTRPWGSSADAVQVLEVAKGGESRPYLRRGERDDPGERLREGGTRVRVWLDRNPFVRSGLLGEVSGVAGMEKEPEERLADHTERLLLHFSAIVGRIAPALDVEVSCLLGLASPMRHTVVKPNDWMDIPFAKLVERLGGPPKSNQKWRKTRMQKDIRRNGELVARIGLCPPHVLA